MPAHTGSVYIRITYHIACNYMHACVSIHMDLVCHEEKLLPDCERNELKEYPSAITYVCGYMNEAYDLTFNGLYQEYIMKSCFV